MGSTRRAFTDEYKAEAVSLVIDGGRTNAEVARNIGVHEMTLGRWVKVARDNGAKPGTQREVLTETEREELARLRRENTELRMQVEFAKKSCDLVRERPAVRFAAIADWAASKEYDVDFMCEQLAVSRAGYYAWRGRPLSTREHTDNSLTTLIKKIHDESRGNAGVRRVAAALRAAGHVVGRRRVLRLMQAAGLQGRHPRAWRKTTIAGDQPVPAPDLISRDFTATAPNTRWCGDITYIRVWDDQWAYVATVIDLYSRKVVGFAVADHMRTSLVTDALTMAITHRKPPPGVIFHSDRGTQYTSKTFDTFCRKNKIRRSLGRTGICYDNAVSESFFATYKKELIHTRPWPSVKQVKTATFEWIEGYYNTRRRHSTLEYLTPHEYELGYRHLDELVLQP